MQVVGGFFPAAFSFKWQSMHVPDLAIGLWNAACLFVFIPGWGGVVWQSRQACWGAVAGFSGFEG